MPKLHGISSVSIKNIKEQTNIVQGFVKIGYEAIIVTENAKQESLKNKKK